jgi:hypothetical protein
MDHADVDGDAPIHADKEGMAANASDRLEDVILRVHPVDRFSIAHLPTHHKQQFPPDSTR